MFSALRQGSVVYILEKGENPVLKVGQVVSITQPNYSSNFLMNGSTIDINVKVNNQNMDFKNVPAYNLIILRLKMLSYTILYMLLTGVEMFSMDLVLLMRNILFSLLKMFLIRSLVLFSIGSTQIWLSRVFLQNGKI